MISYHANCRLYKWLYTAITSTYRCYIPTTTLVGQQFSLDAYTHSTPSFRNNRYTHILTDLASGQHYPIYTKDRSAPELCARIGAFFDLTPQWNHNTPGVNRFIRHDPEANYRSEEFTALCARYRYRLEHIAPRDKHANGSRHCSSQDKRCHDNPCSACANEVLGPCNVLCMCYSFL